MENNNLDINDNHSVADHYIDGLTFLEGTTLKDLSNLLDKTQAIYSQVKDIVTLKLDAQLLASLAKTFEKYVEDNPICEDLYPKYDPDKWAKKLKKTINCSEINQQFWNNLSGHIHFNLTEPFNFMYGTNLQTFTENQNLITNQSTTSGSKQDLKSDKNTTRINYKEDRNKNENSLRRATKINQSQIFNSNNPNDTTTNNEVEKIYKILYKNVDQDNTVPFWPLVVNTISFEKTILNIFHISFLLKDGHVTLLINKNDKVNDTHDTSEEEGIDRLVGTYQPRLKLLQSNEEIQVDLADDLPENNQFLFTCLELTKNQWTLLKRVVKPIN
ncbi:unnamed protein product [Gordionus sp. m RMFG-2023]